MKYFRIATLLLACTMTACHSASEKPECPDCGGTGMMKCQNCDGLGYKVYDDNIPCSVCDNTGYVPCPCCHDAHEKCAGKH